MRTLDASVLACVLLTASAAAAAIAAQNPVLPHGLNFEIRPLESERGSAYRHTNETPEE